jgi:hypothetical protein
MNYLRTAILLSGLMALFMGLGYLIGGSGGALIAFLVAAVTNFFAYWKSDRLVLSMHGAHEVNEQTEPELVQIVVGIGKRRINWVLDCDDGEGDYVLDERRCIPKVDMPEPCYLPERGRRNFPIRRE